MLVKIRWEAYKQQLFFAPHCSITPPLSAVPTWYSPWEAAQSLLLRPSLLEYRTWTENVYRPIRSGPRCTPWLLGYISHVLTSRQVESCSPSLLLSMCRFTRAQIAGFTERPVLGNLHVAYTWGQIKGRFTQNSIDEQTDSAISQIVIRNCRQAPGQLHHWSHLSPHMWFDKTQQLRLRFTCQHFGGTTILDKLMYGILNFPFHKFI